MGAAPPAMAPVTADVTVVAVNLRNDNGVVRACLTNAADHFPKCENPADSMNLVREAAGTVKMTFSGVAPGRYAVALLHDENDNGKADRAAMMIPTEGFGFSRDAKVRFGPPKFRDAAFDVEPGADEKLVIRMRYLL
ncbi:DUF2141 domain-containing protein [Qipengyuania sp.]|uniref:DUF2141 domain-containing protein n=1 Tax=Qipengyuania sp. TaxID=2004515 RepID=UPI0035C7C219